MAKRALTRQQETWLAFLFFLLLTAVFLRPVVFHFFSQISGTGDTYEYVWRLWWFKHAFIDTGQSPWVVPFVYYPYGYPLAYSEVTPTNTIVGLPFTIAWGEYSAHNALLFLAVFLAGFNTFLLVRELTGSWWAGLLAGVLFGFSPYRRGQYFHLNQMTIYWFPLIFLFLERFLRTGRRRYALAGGLAFGFNALASWYFGLAGGLLCLAWIAGRFHTWLALVKLRRTWASLVIFAVTSLVLIVPFLLPYLAASRDPNTRPALESVNFWSASPTDYLIPNQFHPLWGRWIEEKLIPLATLVDKESPTQADFEAGNFLANSNLNISTEFLVSPGLIALLFALYGWRWADRKAIKPWLYVAIISIILSFGLTFHLAGRQVVVPTPSAITTTYNEVMNYLSTHSLQSEPFSIGQDTGIIVPLPALLLRWFVPGIGNIRTWVRFGQFVIFGCAVLAGYGAAAWYQREIASAHRAARRQSVLSYLPWLIVIGLTLFELWWTPMPTHSPLKERPVDVWLHQQPGSEPIIQYPLESSFNGVQFIYTQAHGKPIVHGYGVLFGFMFGRRHPELLTFPDTASLARLHQWGVRYILIETTGPGTTNGSQELLKQVASQACLHPATVQGSIHVFELASPCSEQE